jgi:hypothetical protein
MEKKAVKINIKMFLHDFRGGKSDEDLMRLHGLTRGGLAKLMNVLLERKLLDLSELKSRPSAPQRVAPIPVLAEESRDVWPAQPIHGKIPRNSVQNTGSSCPQCGAQVTERMLSCPECGHVLPGEERWEAVEPKKGLFDRVPPKLLGYIIALPIGIILFFVFKDVILPMSEATMEKRADAIRKELHQGKTPIQTAQGIAKGAGAAIIKLETQRLVNDGVISGASDDYRTFKTGYRWPELSQEEKRKVLEDIRTALRRSGIGVNFRLVDDLGDSLALVSDKSIDLFEGRSPTDSIYGGLETGEQQEPSPVNSRTLDRIPKYNRK